MHVCMSTHTHTHTHMYIYTHIYTYTYIYIYTYNAKLTAMVPVKAMSTEEIETENYKTATIFALSEGVRDAWGSAGMSAINSYLDLGAGVLILWYEKKIAKKKQDLSGSGCAHTLV